VRRLSLTVTGATENMAIDAKIDGGDGTDTYVAAS
jgi:hypothetical protein